MSPSFALGSKMTTHIWLRAETKPSEARVPLVPKGAAALLEKGFTLTVECSHQRCISDEAFSEVGCELAVKGSWTTAPRDAFVLGLKDLPAQRSPLAHRHIYFGHAYKGQPGWRDTLQRFVQGDGSLYDLEFLVDDDNRRVAAFGYWAGFAGTAVAVKTWCQQQLNDAARPISPYPTKQALLSDIRPQLDSAIDAAGKKPRIIVIGAKGRTGTGAVDLAKTLNLETTEWDIAETKTGGPFDAILEHDIFVNCVLVFSKIPPFLTLESIKASTRQLTVVSDVSCDPYGDLNPIPIYDKVTSFKAPTLRIIGGDRPLDLSAIDNLPSLLPLEASEDFASQLLPSLLQLDKPDSGVWARALAVFDRKILELKEDKL
jgi:saccharopine dehydrogenase (NAD+, L-lysine-forming)